MNKPQSTLVALLLAGGCLAPHYGVDATDSASAAGSSGSGSSGKASSAGAEASDGGTESLGGGSNPGEVSDAGGSSIETCDADQKRCGGECVAISDVAYGCSATTCNQSGCPADAEAILGCD